MSTITTDNRQNDPSSSSPSSPLYDVIIVGAGVSGLVAAYELFKRSPTGDLKIKILEANPTRVGGRNYVDESGTDLGSGYIGPTQDRVSRLIDELGLKLHKVFTEGKTIQFINGVATPFDGTIPPVSILGLLDVNNALVEIDRIADSVNLKYPHLTPDAEKWDNITVAEFMRQICATEDAKNLVRTAVRAVVAKEPSEISVLGWCWYVRNSGNIKRILETKNGAQDSKVEGGTGRISLELLKRIPQEWVRLDSPVREIIQDEYENENGEDDDENRSEEGGLVTVRGRDFSYRTKTVILAIPPVQQFRIDFSPPLAPNHFQALQHWPFGHSIKCFVYYSEAFWRKKGFNGSIVSDEGIGLVCMDDTKPDGSKPCIMAFVMSENAAFWGTPAKTPEDRRNALAMHFAKAFGIEDEMDRYPVVDYREHNWASEQYVGGCYTGVPAPTVLTKFANEVNRRYFIDNTKRGLKYQIEHEKNVAPSDNANIGIASNSKAGRSARIFVAGTESAAEFVGYVEGAVEAGQRSAANVLHRLHNHDSADDDEEDENAARRREHVKHFNAVTKPQPSKQNPFVHMDLSFAEKRILPSVNQLQWGCAIGATVTTGVALGIFLSKKKESGNS